MVRPAPAAGLPAGPAEAAGGRGGSGQRWPGGSGPASTCAHTLPGARDTQIGENRCAHRASPTAVGRGFHRRRGPAQQSGRRRQRWPPAGGQPALTWWPEGRSWPGPAGTAAKLMAGSGNCCCGSRGRVRGGSPPRGRAAEHPPRPPAAAPGTQRSLPRPTGPPGTPVLGTRTSSSEVRWPRSRERPQVLSRDLSGTSAPQTTLQPRGKTVASVGGTRRNVL